MLFLKPCSAHCFLSFCLSFLISFFLWLRNGKRRVIWQMTFLEFCSCSSVISPLLRGQWEDQDLSGRWRTSRIFFTTGVTRPCSAHQRNRLGFYQNINSLQFCYILTHLHGAILLFFCPAGFGALSGSNQRLRQPQSRAELEFRSSSEITPWLESKPGTLVEFKHGHLHYNTTATTTTTKITVMIMTQSLQPKKYNKLPWRRA